MVTKTEPSVLTMHKVSSIQNETTKCTDRSNNFSAFSLDSDMPLTHRVYHQAIKKPLKPILPKKAKAQDPVIPSPQHNTQTSIKEKEKEVNILDLVNQIKKQREARSLSQREQFKLFRSSLPENLQRIDTLYDIDSLTPLFNHHKKNLARYGSEPASYNESFIKLAERERSQRMVFIESKQEFAKNNSRNIYMSHILNNLGLGEGYQNQTKDQLRLLMDHHREKVSNHCKTRNLLLDSGGSLPLLSQQEEHNLERTKEQVIKRYEQQSKVGPSLKVLRIEAAQIDETLEQTIEFNERILDPVNWSTKIREKQQLEISEFQRIRDRTKIKIILRSQRLNKTNQQQALKKQKSIFTEQKLITSSIMRTATNELRMRKSASVNSEDLQDVKLDNLNDKFQFTDSLLDQKNKQIMHLKRIQKLKSMKRVNESQEFVNRNLVASLMQSIDPFVRHRQTGFKQSYKKGTQTFLQRMQRDQSCDRCAMRQVCQHSQKSQLSQK